MHALSSIMGLACWQFSEVQLSQYIEAGVGVWIIKGAVGCICTDTTVNLGDIRGLGKAWRLFSYPPSLVLNDTPTLIKPSIQPYMQVCTSISDMHMASSIELLSCNLSITITTM